MEPRDHAQEEPDDEQPDDRPQAWVRTSAGPGDPAHLVEIFQVAVTVPPHRRELVIALLDEEDRIWALAPGSSERVAAAAALKGHRATLSGDEHRLLKHLQAEGENRRRAARRAAERRVPCPVCAAGPGMPCRDAHGEPASRNHIARRRAATAAGRGARPGRPGQ